MPWREAVEIGGGDRRRPRRGARQGHRPSRSQAGERVPHERRHVKILDFGLALQRLESPADRTARPMARTRAGHRARHVRLHVARAGDRRARRRPHRHLRARLPALRDAGRAAAVRAAARRRKSSPGCCTTAAPDLSTFDPLAPPELRADRRRAASSASRAAIRIGARTSRRRCAALRQRLGDQACRRRRPRARGKSLAVLPFVNARRSAARLPDRRHHREHHQQPVPARRPPRRPAQPGVPVQGAAGRSVRPSAWR